MSKMDITLEIDLGITGGEEDGIDKTEGDNADLYTLPEDVAYAYEELFKISKRNKNEEILPIHKDIAASKANSANNSDLV